MLGAKLPNFKYLETMKLIKQEGNSKSAPVFYKLLVGGNK